MNPLKIFKTLLVNTPKKVEQPKEDGIIDFLTNLGPAILSTAVEYYFTTDGTLTIEWESITSPNLISLEVGYKTYSYYVSNKEDEGDTKFYNNSNADLPSLKVLTDHIREIFPLKVLDSTSIEEIITHHSRNLKAEVGAALSAKESYNLIKNVVNELL